MGKLLVELQVRKSTADGAGARQYYTDLTNPMDLFTTAEVRNLVRHDLYNADHGLSPRRYSRRSSQEKSSNNQTCECLEISKFRFKK
jgi:hypothetical protein